MSIRTEARFPPIAGETLHGRSLGLPGGFEKPLTVLLVAFGRDQQAAVDTWLPVADDIRASCPDVCCYELAVVDRIFRPAKPFIDGRMRTALPDATVRERTITAYTDKATVRRALDIEDETEIHAFLLDRDGIVYWRAVGPRNDENATHLREIVESLS
jgi:hypothetical protein